MTVLVFGRNGQLANALIRHPWSPNADGSPRKVVALGSAEADIRDAVAVTNAITTHQPTLVVNAAAYTAVDKAESEPEAAYAVNETGSGAIAHAAAAAGIPLIHVSTDYVFDGTGTSPYREDQPTAPLGVYGASKLAGEKAVAAAGGRTVSLRTSWVFSADGNNFVKTMLRLGADRPALRVVADQVGRPTAAADIAAAIAFLEPFVADGRASGVLHFAGAEAISWHGFAEAIFDEAAALGRPRPSVAPITTADYPTPAKRPAYSVLACDRFLALPGASLPDWRVALRQVVTDLVG
ncbi:dTDP-4-dehydrorhamnose reductase [Niveispirillum sp. SYP-B3756]|uniref:dTDP-4-dehydrorhamnose reductase n=1 Tax=Niveispirillum sp. SYP-B3756 TaxID=2662178 RepID=UPI0012922563|nr:dTDP-4-dehydrorhamnose reductase [Niveispirillum sp. SYP-B3756]MQP64543.1 dTDP-4-dehydrorhamnose reductase [Niveispirillum sp. SYP-B3756]